MPEAVPPDLEKLACPRCKGPLALAEPAALDCAVCRLRFAIDRGVPVMLVTHAQALPGHEE